MNYPPLRDPTPSPEERRPERRSDRAAARDPAADGGPATGASGSEPGDEDDLEPLLLDEQMIVAEPTGPVVPVSRLGTGPVPAAIRTPEARAAGDEPIPMLTEVVQVPRYDTEDLPQSLADIDWGDLSQRVRENVLERLLRRSDALLDAQLQSTLAPVLERAAETVAHELHDALNRMIRDIVARAVTEELTRLHTEIARRNRHSRPS